MNQLTLYRGAPFLSIIHLFNFYLRESVGRYFYRKKGVPLLFIFSFYHFLVFWFSGLLLAILIMLIVLVTIVVRMRKACHLQHKF